MMTTWHLRLADEVRLSRLAELVALKIRAGDTIALAGDLGAGKTTFARALIRAVLDDAGAEVPSPTFSLAQVYPSQRLTITHLDLYRLQNEDEADELGIDDLRSTGALIIEWPDRAPALLGPDRLHILITESDDADHRDITLTAAGSWQDRLARLMTIDAFLNQIPEARTARVRYLQGDASARAYARIVSQAGSWVLMDWVRQPDGPPIRNGLPYSRIARLAEDTRAFCGIQELLASVSIGVPAIYATDHDHGLLLIEDLGDKVFSAEIAAGRDMAPLWRAATDVLIRMSSLDEPHIQHWNAKAAGRHKVAEYDYGALEIEIELLCDWYWPLTAGRSMQEAERKRFMDLWRPVLERVLTAPSRCLTLRDYHSPNLIWCADRGREAADMVGVIDFQDALLGPAAFDLVSLLQDARVDVPTEIEAQCLARYLSLMQEKSAHFDREAFLFAYAALGAQRNTKILGIFARLWKRDGKSQYLRHIPRIWRYLDRNLTHPELAGLADWYTCNFPGDARAEPLPRP